MRHLDRFQDTVPSLCVNMAEVTLHFLDLHIAFVFSLDVEIWRKGQGLKGCTCIPMNLSILIHYIT